VEVRVKLLGTLPALVEGGCPATGLRLTLPDQATLTDLVERLGIDPARIGIATVNGQLAKASDTIPAGAEIKLLQRLAGG
jgi:sulfur carrier protein ThiS